MDEPILLPSATKAEQITFLRAAVARCRRLASATADVDLTDTLLAMAMDYEIQLRALVNSPNVAPE